MLTLFAVHKVYLSSTNAQLWHCAEVPFPSWADLLPVTYAGDMTLYKRLLYNSQAVGASSTVLSALIGSGSATSRLRERCLSRLLPKISYLGIAGMEPGTTPCKACPLSPCYGLSWVGVCSFRKFGVGNK